jgi:prepilin peptidase CpaA
MPRPGPAIGGVSRVRITVLTVPSIAFAAVMALALVHDVRERRIPNWLVLAGLAAGIGLRVAAGAGPFGMGVAGAALALMLTFPLFLLRGMGGGDVKLFVVAGAFLGPLAFLYALVASALIGGAIGLVAALKNGVLLTALLRTRDLAFRAATLGRQGERMTIDTAGAITVPYGAAIALGSLAVWFLLPGAMIW